MFFLLGFGEPFAVSSPEDFKLSGGKLESFLF